MSVYQHILAAVDLNAHSTKVLQHASALARVCDAEMTVLHVVNGGTSSDADHVIATEDEDDNRRVGEAERQLYALLEREALTNGVQSMVTFGHPGIEIVRQAERVNADLIVIGLRTGQGISMLVGHTVHHVLTSDLCNVLLIR